MTDIITKNTTAKITTYQAAEIINPVVTEEILALLKALSAQQAASSEVVMFEVFKEDIRIWPKVFANITIALVSNKENPSTCLPNSIKVLLYKKGPPEWVKNCKPILLVNDICFCLNKNIF